MTATGDEPLSYQWQITGDDIPGASSQWFTRSFSTENGVAFRAIVNNGSGTVIRAATTLTAEKRRDGPVITIQPADRSVTAAGVAPFKYQWTKNDIDIALVSTASFTILTAIAADCGSSSAIGPRSTLTMLPVPGAPIIVANPDRPHLRIDDRGKVLVNFRWADKRCLVIFCQHGLIVIATHR